MRHFFPILRHELRVLLLSPSTYVAAVLFLVVMGVTFQSILEDYSGAPQETPPGILFFDAFWLPVFFMVPLLTMKCISEEHRLGTLETLLTAPVSTAEVVLGKYVAAYLLYLVLWLSTLGFNWILYAFAQDPRLLDPGPLVGGYVFIAVSGLFFVAVGILSSALSRTQAVAGILAFALLFATVIGLRMLAEQRLLDATVLEPLRAAVQFAQVWDHRDDFVRGVVDSRQVVFYLSGAALTLIFSILGLEMKILQS